MPRLPEVRLFFLSLALAVGISSANATTLKYVGPEFFFGIIQDGHVEATVNFSTPLTEGAVLSLADISSFSLSMISPFHGDRTITSNAATYTFAELTIGPDGLPSDWGLGAELNIEGTSNPEQISTIAGTTTTLFGQSVTSNKDAFLIDDPEPNSPFGFGSGGGGATFSVRGTGTWTLVPEPGTFLIFSVAIISIVVARTKNLGIVSIA